MSRRSRVVIPNIPHHITQRGGRRQDVFFTELDRQIYLNLLTENAAKYGTGIVAYTLMTNHVHHLVVPYEKDSLQWTFQITHKRYADYINTREGWTGHFWQARFYSSPVDDEYFWVTLRYILQNALRAGITQHPADYAWSSASSLCKGVIDPVFTASEKWRNLLSEVTNWYSWLATEEDLKKVELLRKHTRRDLPVGSEEFLDRLVREHGVVARSPPIGRPKAGKS
jgi:putative transposase